jgi:hypothetical protein
LTFATCLLRFRQANGQSKAPLASSNNLLVVQNWTTSVAHEERGRQLVRGNLSARVRLVVSLSAVLACAAVRAEDLDQGKSGQRLFADSCAACHKSAKGLTKRGYLTLYFFLKDHYASNSTSAWALTSYLESVDSAPRSRSRKSAEKATPPPQINRTSGAPPRPPAAVPQR